MQTFDDILQQALKLPYAEREKLIQQVWASLHPPADDITEEEYNKAWAAEIERRLAAVDRGEIVMEDWRDVLARARKFPKSASTLQRSSDANG